MTSSNTSTDVPKRAVIYARVSKDRKGSGLGTAAQAADCRELAARLSLDVVEVRSDNDLTAFKGTARSKPRPGYNALLADIRSGRAEVVLAWHTDRLHRDLPELEGYVDACQPGNVPTYTVQGGDLDLSTASGRMVARILGAVARQEVEHMVERQLSGKKRAREAGAYQGGPRPFGYRSAGKGTGRIVQVPEEAAAIREGYRLLLAGASLSAIIRDWNARRTLTPAEAARGGGLEWGHKAVRDVLLAARNAGLVEYRGRTASREIAGKGKWEPIVDEQTWRAARAILFDPARRTTPGPKPRWLLPGVLVCGKCGGRRFRVSQRSADHTKHQYMCMPTRWNQDWRPFHIARAAEPLDEYVTGIVIERLSRPDAAAALAKPGVDVAELESRRTGLRARLDELGAVFAAGDIDGLQLAAGSRPLRAQIEEAEQALSAAYRETGLAEFAGVGDAAFDVWDGLDIERRRAVVATLLQVKLLPADRGIRPFDYSAVQILPPRGADSV